MGVKFFDFGLGFGNLIFNIPDEAGGHADIARTDFFNGGIHILFAV
jgi:hypothetical protein